MTTNILNTQTRDLITQAIHELDEVRMPLPMSNPVRKQLNKIYLILTDLNWQVVIDDIRQMADTINQHVTKLQELTTAIEATTAELQHLADTLDKVAKAVGFLLTVYAQATGLGLIDLVMPAPPTVSTATAPLPLSTDEG